MPDKFVTLDSLSTYKQLEENRTNSLLADKVDKVPDKGLSTNDYTDQEKAAVASALQPGDIVFATEQEVRALFKEYPVKGNVISFDAFGDGTSKRFLVLKKQNKSTATLLGLDTTSEMAFSTSKPETVQVSGPWGVETMTPYENSLPDIYLNETYYNSLSATTKGAIIDQMVVQYLDKGGASGSGTGSGDHFRYLYRNEQNYYYWQPSSAFQCTREVGTRHIFTLGMNDLLDFYEDYFIVEDTFHYLTAEMIQTLSHLGNVNLWSLSCNSWTNGVINYIRNGNTSNSWYYDVHEARPVFVIDLSQIDFTIEGGNN